MDSIYRKQNNLSPTPCTKKKSNQTKHKTQHANGLRDAEKITQNMPKAFLLLLNQQSNIWHRQQQIKYQNCVNFCSYTICFCSKNSLQNESVSYYEFLSAIGEKMGSVSNNSYSKYRKIATHMVRTFFQIRKKNFL